MTIAPPEALQARQELIDEFDMNPGRVVDNDLDPAEVGIVGGSGHVGTDTYHCGAPELPTWATYSRTESRRDNRVEAYAAALDIGHFANGKANLRHFSIWLVEQCKKGVSWTQNIREVIYSPDGYRVVRWDRLGVRNTGDESHLWHTHISFFRDSRCGGALAMVRAYIAYVGGNPAAPADTEEEVDVDLRRYVMDGVPLPGTSLTHNQGQKRGYIEREAQKGDEKLAGSDADLKRQIGELQTANDILRKEILALKQQQPQVPQIDYRQLAIAAVALAAGK